MRTYALERLRSVMVEQDIGSVLVTEEENLRYLTGIKKAAGTLLVEQEDTQFLASKFFRYADAVDTVYTSSEQREKARSELIAEAEVADTAMEDLAESDVLADARRIKTAEEINHIRAAASIGDRSFERFLQCFSPGMTEWEGAAVVDERIRAGGAYNAFDTLVHADTVQPHRLPSDHTIVTGETVLVDCGARVEGYCSDMTRMLPNACAGDQQELIDAVAQLQQLALEHVSAGTEIAALASAVEERVPELGYSLDEHYLHSLGHGVGVAVHEAPTLHTSVDGELEEGMVVTIEPGLYVPGVGGARIEDEVVVTADGYERLTGQKRIYERD